MSRGELGCILTPNGSSLPQGAVFCADNGCFGKNYVGDDAWFQWLSRLPDRARCSFATAPDVVGDAEATLERSTPWLPLIRALAIPAAFVAQDGADRHPPPWGAFDVLFLGGSTSWKLGPVAHALTREAKARGCWVHMGRVNSLRRMRHARAIGCDSADGTFLAFGPDINLPQLKGWITDARHPWLPGF